MCRKKRKDVENALLLLLVCSERENEREEAVSSDWLSTNDKVGYKLVVLCANITEM